MYPGTYNVTANFTSDDPNYTNATGTTQLTISPGVLTYTATPVTRTYNTANPAFTGTVTGFVGSDNLSNATTGTLTFTSPATMSSSPGKYAINGSGLTANNGAYTFYQASSNATALTITSPSTSTPVTFNNKNTPVAAFGKSTLSTPMSVTAGGTNTVAFATVWVDEGYGSPQIVNFNVTATYGGQAMTSAGPTTYNFSYAPISAQVFYLVNPPTGSNTLTVTATATSGTIQEVVANLVSFNNVSQTAPVRPGSYTGANNGTIPSGSFTAPISSNPSDLILGTVEATYTFATPASNQTVDATAADYYKVGDDHGTVGAATVNDTWSFTNPYAFYAYAGFSIQAAGGAPPPTLQSIAVTPASPSISKGTTQQFTATGTYSDSSTVNITDAVTWTSATTSVATFSGFGLATGVGTGTSNITASLNGVTSPIDVLTASTSPAVTFNNTNTAVAAFGSSTLSTPMTVTPGGANTVAFATVWIDEASGAPGTTFTVTASYGGQTMTSAGATAYDYNYAPISSQVFYLVGPPTGSNTLVVTATASSGTIQEIVANMVSFNGVNLVTPIRPGTYQTLHSAPSVTVGSFTATIASNASDLTLAARGATLLFCVAEFISEIATIPRPCEL